MIQPTIDPNVIANIETILQSNPNDPIFKHDYIQRLELVGIISTDTERRLFARFLNDADWHIIEQESYKRHERARRRDNEYWSDRYPYHTF